MLQKPCLSVRSIRMMSSPFVARISSKNVVYFSKDGPKLMTGGNGQAFELVGSV